MSIEIGLCISIKFLKLLLLLLLLLYADVARKTLQH